MVGEEQLLLQTLGNGDIGKQLSTGNKIFDILGGGLYGLANASQKRGQYVPMFNWQGNGLARGGMEYLSNPDYTNMYDAAQATSASLFGNKKDKQNRDTFGSMKERLSTMLGKPLFGIDNSNPYGLNTKEYTLPEVAGVGGGTIGGQGYNPQYYSYGLPTQSLDFNKFWE